MKKRKMKRIILTIMFLGMMFVISEDAMAQRCMPNANQVDIFIDANFSGAFKILPVGRYRSPIINGRNVGFVRYNGGTFVSGGQKAWFEYKNGKREAHATFYELGRDEWSVYLKKDDGAEIQLDLHKKQIKFNGGFIYSITEVRER
jgi:hypothetical protein